MGDLAWLLWFLVAITVIPAVVCLLKGKLVTTALGIVYQPIGIIGACRLAKPGSFWARHLYGPRSRRLTRAERRFGAAYAARLDRWRDIVGGAPADRDVTPPDTYVTPPDTTTAGEPIGGAPADPTGLTKKIGHRAVDRKNSCRRAKATMKRSCDLGLSVLHDVRTRPWRALVARSAGAPDTCPRARSPSRPAPLPSAALTRRCFP
jgi:hypothetical protein